MTHQTRARLAAVIALLVAGSALAYVAMSDLEDNLVYYWNAEELHAKGDAARSATIRLGGMVQRASVLWEPDTLRLEFNVGMSPEQGDPTVRVHAKGAPPQMFQEGMGVVVEGTYDGTVFNAHRVMVKHSNEYRAPQEGHAPQELYDSLLNDA